MLQNHPSTAPFYRKDTRCVWEAFGSEGPSRSPSVTPTPQPSSPQSAAGRSLNAGGSPGFKWGFPKMEVPNNKGFPTKNDHFGVFWGYHHSRKHPNVNWENWREKTYFEKRLRNKIDNFQETLHVFLDWRWVNLSCCFSSGTFNRVVISKWGGILW